MISRIVFIVFMIVAASFCGGFYFHKNVWAVPHGPRNARRPTYESAVNFDYDDKYAFLGERFFSRDRLYGTVASFTPSQLYDDYFNNNRAAVYDDKIVSMTGRVAWVQRRYQDWFSIGLFDNGPDRRIVNITRINPVYRELVDLIVVGQTIKVRGICQCKNPDPDFLLLNDTAQPRLTHIEFIPTLMH